MLAPSLYSSPPSAISSGRAATETAIAMKRPKISAASVIVWRAPASRARLSRPATESSGSAADSISVGRLQSTSNARNDVPK